MARAEALKNSGRVSSPLSSQAKSFENTLAFVTDERVSSLPIGTKVQTPPRNKWMTQAQWERGWEITGEFFGTDKIFKEIGRDSNITRVRAHQIVENRVEQLYQIQSKEVKSEYPLEQFSYRKPLPVSSRRRISNAKGGIAVKVEQALMDGKTIPQIKNELTSRQFISSRRILHGWGIEIPYEQKPILPRFVRLRDTELPDEEKQKLLDSVNHNGVQQVLSSGEEPLVMSVSKIAEQAGLFLKNDKINIIYLLLKNKGVPASSYSRSVKYRGENRNRTKPTYYFICASDRDRAIEIIKDAKELDQFRVNPVIVLGKATDRPPRYGELRFSGNYSYLGILITEIRGKSIRKIKTEDVILDDCPVPVFRYNRGRDTLYRLDEKEQLRKYLKKRLKKLGFLKS